VQITLTAVTCALQGADYFTTIMSTCSVYLATCCLRFSWQITTCWKPETWWYCMIRKDTTTVHTNETGEHSEVSWPVLIYTKQSLCVMEGFIVGIGRLSDWKQRYVALWITIYLRIWLKQSVVWYAIVSNSTSAELTISRTKSSMVIVRHSTTLVVALLLATAVSWAAQRRGGAPDLCVPMPTNLTLCRGVGYNSIRFPNLFGHETVDEATRQSNSWLPLVNIHCHRDTQV